MTKVIAEYTGRVAGSVMSYRERVCIALIAILVVLVGYYVTTIQRTVFNIAERERIVHDNSAQASELQDAQSQLFKLRSKLDLSLASSRGLVEPAKTIYITSKSLGQARASAHEL